MIYAYDTREQLIERIKKQEVLIHELENQNEILKELSALDELTKISNQRTLVHFLDAQLKNMDRATGLLCIAIFDIDDFQRINDTMGHVCGNGVLACIADIIQQNIRKTDLAGRYGGDEFMVIFTNTELEMAQIIAERIRRTVAEAVFTDGLKVTVSGGVIEYSGEDFIDLIHFADLNLYRAKGHGKNQIV